MKNTEKRQHEMLARVRNFSTAHPELFPEASVAAATLATLEAAVQQLDTAAAA
jgi:hypothetical protein